MSAAWPRSCRSAWARRASSGSATLESRNRPWTDVRAGVGRPVRVRRSVQAGLPRGAQDPTGHRRAGHRAGAPAGSTSRCANPGWPDIRGAAPSVRRCDAGRMPEGDVVWRTARQLDAALTGRVLTCSDFRVPRYATTDLTGRTVMATVSRGKHLLTRVDGGVTIHTHLRMDGSWRIRPAGGYLPAITGSGWCWLTTRCRPSATCSASSRSCRPSDEEKAVGHLGPDLLGPDWDRGRGDTPSAGRPGPPGRRGAARSAESGRHRQHVPVRDAVPARLSRGGRSARSRTARPGRPGPAAAGGEQGAGRPGHHRGSAARPGDLGIRQAGPAMPPLWHGRSAHGRSGPAAPAAPHRRRDHVLVPPLSARRRVTSRDRRTFRGAAGGCAPPPRRMRASVRRWRATRRALRNRISPAISATAA